VAKTVFQFKAIYVSDTMHIQTQLWTSNAEDARAAALAAFRNRIADYHLFAMIAERRSPQDAFRVIERIDCGVEDDG